MTEETVTQTLVEEMLEKVNHCMRSVELLSRDLAASRRELKGTVEMYNTALDKLAAARIKSEKYAWCTNCLKLFYLFVGSDEKPSAQLVLTEGSREYTHGEGGAYYGFQDFSELHRACPVCYEMFTAQHGQVGPYDKHARGQSRFLAFRVEKREDGYYVGKFGAWTKLDKTNQLPGITHDTVLLLAIRLWILPPKIELRDDKLIVHGAQG